MKIRPSKDIGEEIISKLKELEYKLNQILKKQNEKELSNIHKNRN